MESSTKTSLLRTPDLYVLKSIWTSKYWCFISLLIFLTLESFVVLNEMNSDKVERNKTLKTVSDAAAWARETLLVEALGTADGNYPGTWRMGQYQP